MIRVTTESPLLSAREGMLYSKTPRTSFYKAAAQGRFNILKRGHRSFVRKAELDAWLDSLPTAQLGPAS